jgi:hypothetical protein
MATNQNTTVRVTFFPEDIKVGQDVTRVAAMSREILVFDGQNRIAGAFSSFLKEQTGNGSLTRFGGAQPVSSSYDAPCPSRS